MLTSPTAVCATTALAPTRSMLRGPGRVAMRLRTSPVSRSTATMCASVSAVTSTTGSSRSANGAAAAARRKLRLFIPCTTRASRREVRQWNTSNTESPPTYTVAPSKLVAQE